MNGSRLYRVFLLRLWREEDGRDVGVRPAPLRILLEDPHSGERQAFPDLESLIDFLLSQLE